MNKLFRLLAFLTPRFLTRIDGWLVTRHPLLWSSRFVHVVFYTLTTLLIFELLIYFIPLVPTIVFVPLYISYISLVFGCVGLGIWLHSQSQYNIWRSFGKSTSSFPYRYTLTCIASLVLFIACACLPCWNAANRAYDYIFNEDIYRVVAASSERIDRFSPLNQLKALPSKKEVDNAQFTSRNRIARMEEESDKLKDKLSDQNLLAEERQQSIGRVRNLERLSTELTVALRREEPRFWILYKQFFTANISDKEANLARTDNVPILVNGHRYIEYETADYNYYESAYYYRDEYGNFLQYRDFINWVILENIAKRLFSSEFTSLVDVCHGKIELKKNEPQRFFRTLTDLTSAPWLFNLSETSALDSEFVIILVQIVFASILALTLAATLSSFFGIKAFFINLIFVILSTTALIVMFAVIDQTSRHMGDDEIGLLAFGLVFFFAFIALLTLYRARKKRVIHGFLWLLSSVTLPLAFIFSLLLLLSGLFNIDPHETGGLMFTTVALLLCAMWYLPSQMRLLYRIYALPR